jgi:8-oxo-dGTP pyrophosphatase MutT (NUDIX family)
VSEGRPRATTAAAGGVVWRRDGLDLQVALVHRPRYDDWSLPKGKVNPDEQLLMAAVREVGEETGAAVQVGRRLTPVEYPLAGQGRKRVSHWAMRYLSGEHLPGTEVDLVRWSTIAEASRQLSYSVDRVVLADFARVPATASTVVLIRHAKAGKRSAFSGDDRRRPLDKIGRRHAREAVPFWAAFRPVRVLAADRTRCEQTVAPLAEHLGLALASAPEFSDEAFADDPERALESLFSLAALDGTTVICSQGGAIPGMLESLSVPGEFHPARKGSAWVLSLSGRRVVAADYYPHPNT